MTILQQSAVILQQLQMILYTLIVYGLEVFQQVQQVSVQEWYGATLVNYVSFKK